MKKNILAFALLATINISPAYALEDGEGGIPDLDFAALKPICCCRGAGDKDVNANYKKNGNVKNKQCGPSSQPSTDVCKFMNRRASGAATCPGT